MTFTNPEATLTLGSGVQLQQCKPDGLISLLYQRHLQSEVGNRSGFSFRSLDGMGSILKKGEQR